MLQYHLVIFFTYFYYYFIFIIISGIPARLLVDKNEYKDITDDLIDVQTWALMGITSEQLQNYMKHQFIVHITYYFFTTFNIVFF